MKKIAIVLLIAAVSILNAASEQFVKTNLSGVTVFLRGAELTHTAKAKVNKGVSEIIFNDVALNIDQNSLNVSAKGDFIILSVVQRLDYLNQSDSNPVIKSLKDSLELMNNKLVSKQNEIEVWNSELDFLNANKELGGKDKAITIAELQKMAEFFRKRVGDIKTQLSSLVKENKKIQKEIDRINEQLKELNNKFNQPSNQIMVTVSSKTQTTGEFTIQYYVYDAGWNPTYDIRVNNVNNPAILNYKANVNQNSGIDWNDINITLSTRNPVQNNNKPELYPWFVDFQKPVAMYKENRAISGGLSPAPKLVSSAVTTLDAESIADYTDVNQSQLSVEFIPAIKYSIPSDNKHHSVSLKDFTIPAKYEYYAAPKLDNNAFLVANLTNWNDYNLMPGQANIYFENSYVGQSFINPSVSKDTLTVSLGRDQGIFISKEMLKDFSEDKFLSSDIERTFAFNIIVKNNKNIPVKILVEEQIPISKTEDIEVKLVDASGGIYSAVDGKIKWYVELDASKSLTKKLVYSVRYPKDKSISNL